MRQIAKRIRVDIANLFVDVLQVIVDPRIRR